MFFVQCRYEEMMTDNLRSLTGKYQDLEDSYSKLLHSETFPLLLKT